MPLKGSHADRRASGDEIRKFVSRVGTLSCIFVKSLVHFKYLIPRGITQVNFNIHSTRTNQSGIQPFNMIRCHEYNPSFCGSNSIQSIKQPAESDSRRESNTSRMF